MEHYNADEVNYDLIARHLDGEATEIEKENLENWVNRSEANASVYASAKLLWKDAQPGHFEESSDVFSVNSDAAWLKVQKRIQTPKAGKRIYLQTWLRVAAILVIGMPVLYLMYNWLNPTVEQISSISGESHLSVELVDGSKVELNANSDLTYPEEFKGNNRRVVLTGEAFFEIEKDSSKPFTITANEVNINVLGTSFNVNANSLDSVEVQVETGRVEMNYGENSLVLNPDETGVYYKLTGKLFKREKKVISSHFWRNRRLTFKRTSLQDVVRALNSLYEVNIRLEGNQVADKKINVRFEDEDIAVILDVIANSLDLEVDHLKNDTIILRNANY